MYVSGAADLAEQPYAFLLPVDVQVGDGAAVAVELPGVGSGAVSDGFPAGAVVPVGVGGTDAGPALGVEVQVGGKLIAFAGFRAAQPRQVVGVSLLVLPGVQFVVFAVSVQVVAHGVQLV